jgi:transposase
MGKSYPSEYRTEAMKLVEEIGKQATSKRLGVTEWTLSRWAKKGEQEKKEERTERSAKLVSELREAQEKIKEMEKEIARIKKENEFLEDAASFFAASRQKSKQS